ncbi:MAG: hypothetical protein H6978_14995 [Gammaproteobacteria bacterium]|nr:hypothetical protein [Gammaproteobacteria bacterium]
MHAMKLMLSATLLAASTQVSAITGSEFLARCDGLNNAPKDETPQQAVDRALQAGSCIGIVGGVVQGVNLVGSMLQAQKATTRQFVCLPDGVQATELLELVLSDLRKQPADAGAQAPAHIYRSIMARYACPAETATD